MIDGHLLLYLSAVNKNKIVFMTPYRNVRTYLLMKVKRLQYYFWEANMLVSVLH